MYLSQLMYASRCVDPGRPVADQILRTARQRNRACDITGLLLFDGVYFFQLLEGDRTLVSRLYHRIVNDQRHSDVVLLSAGPAEERMCSGWWMGYVDDQPAIRDAVLRFSTSGTFDPYTMAAASALRLASNVVANAEALRVATTDHDLTRT